MYIKVYVTEAEKEHLQEVARLKEISLSELCYRQMDPLLKKPAHRFLTWKEKPVKLQIYTEDISLLTMRVCRYIDQLYSFIAALVIRQQLYEADYEQLIQIADDTRIAL